VWPAYGGGEAGTGPQHRPAGTGAGGTERGWAVGSAPGNGAGWSEGDER
jgi:hypothetical protein